MTSTRWNRRPLAAPAAPMFRTASSDAHRGAASAATWWTERDRGRSAVVAKGAGVSLFAVLYSAELVNPALVLTIAFPNHLVVVEPPRAHVALPALHATASLTEPSARDLDALGLRPRTAVCFAFDVSRSAEARRLLVAAVKAVLAAMHGDVVVICFDELIVRRVASMAACVNRYADMLPADGASWTIVSNID